MPKNTRTRQLAKQHQRRQAERLHARRQRRVRTIAVALVIALVGSVGVFIAFTAGDEPAPAATGGTGETGGEATGSTGEPGSRTGSVDPEPGPEQVACGAEQPKEALRPKPQFSAPAQVVEQGQTYTAEVRTSCGTITVELLADQAPETVNSFVFLARQGYFDGQRIHRLDTSIDVIQGGDPTGTGSGSPGYSIPDELTGDEAYGPGVLAMANAGPDTGGSQFFIVTGEDGHALDDQAAWTIFGTVIDGLDVARQIQELEIQDPAAGIAGQQPAEAVYLEKVKILEGS
ncbi:MAG TPA: peptidylprolyl isomerase [Actinomycetota bacterium]|nr:peptidylprolyl isomerase [Actinomycetota bacterium]